MISVPFVANVGPFLALLVCTGWEVCVIVLEFKMSSQQVQFFMPLKMKIFARLL
jgi:hypothetical protein